MAKKLRLVIDASIARAIGLPQSVKPPGKECRDFLNEVLAISHRVVMSDKCQSEWKRHASRYAQSWLVNMYGRRKVDRILDNPDHFILIGTEIENCAAREVEREEMTKDIHLVFAAFQTDRFVVSLETNAPRLYQKHLPALLDRFPHEWIVLMKNPEAVQLWLHGKGGAEAAIV